MDSHTAVREAGIHRFRPALLTTLTTFGGLAPMIFETSRQARFLIPMAVGPFTYRQSLAIRRDYQIP